MYDPKITARKATTAAGETFVGAGALVAVVTIALSVAWWVLPTFGVVVPESVKQEVTPERVALVACTAATSPLWSALGRATRNWHTHRPRKTR